MGNIFELLVVQPITNLLIAIYQLLILFHVPSALGFSIILLTVAIRFLLFPLMSKQLKASQKMQEIAPLLTKLKKQYKNNPQRLQAETVLLYKQHGINPAAGCLPVLIQLPVIWGLYSVLQHVVKQTTLNEVNKLVYIDVLKLKTMWDTHFFGIPLGQMPSQLINTLGVWVLFIPFLTGFTQFLQSKMMFVTSSVKKNDQKIKKNSDVSSDFAAAFQTQSMYIFPLMIGFFSYTFPVGLSLYWITFTVFGIIQQYKIQGWGGLHPFLLRLGLSKKKNNSKKK